MNVLGNLEQKVNKRQPQTGKLTKSNKQTSELSKKNDKSRLEVGCKPFSQSWVDWINCIVERFRIQEFSNGYRKVDYQILKPSTVHWLNGVIIKKITLKISTACSLSEYKQLRKVKTQAVEFTRRSSVSGVNVHKNRGNSSEIFSLLMIMDG